MAKYEMMVILVPNISEDQVQQEVTKYKEFLGQYDTQQLNVKIWGKRRLAYPIGKFIDGIYVLFNYEGDGKQVAPLERSMRLSEEVMRFLTIKLSDKVKEEITATKTEAVVAPALVS